MPIVEGRYEMKIGTGFRKAEEGIEEIKKHILKSRAVRVNNIPMALLEELKPLLKGKDLRIILPQGEEKTAELEELGKVAVTKSRIYSEYDGDEANMGSISFSDIIFNIAWLEGRILEISTMEYSKCVKCLGKTFDMAWRYAKK